MRKFSIMLLVAAMIFSLFGCGSSESSPAKKAGLQAGFGRADITPGYEVNMAGSASSRVTSDYLDRLYLTCIALREQEETYLICTMDFVECNDVFVTPAKQVMSEETGVPVENILMCATHTHSSVSIGSSSCKNVEQYRKEFFDWARQAAKDAVADLSDAEVAYGSIETQGMAWVRHYEMKDGTYAGANYGSFSSGIVGHVSEADPEMQLIKFDRSKDGKKDIVMVNFPAHATMTSSSNALSADFPSPTRSYIEQNSNSLVAYFIAAAGDQVPSSRIETETFNSDYNIYGEELGHYAVSCMNNLTQLEGSGIIHSKRTFSAGGNKEDLDRLEEAKQVQQIWNQVGGRGTSEGKNAAIQAGFSSVYQVTSILNRATAPDINEMDIHALTIGEISFIFAPYEMFGTQGMYIKENSPYALTFVITCCEADEGYLPSQLGWEIGCYESQITKFERGSAEKLAEEFVAMLTEIKNTQS